MEKYFKMNVMGSSQGVNDFVAALQQHGILQLAEKKDTDGQLDNGLPYIAVLCSGSQPDPTADITEVVKNLSKETGVLAEIYIEARGYHQKNQGHIIVDRGSFFTNEWRELEAHSLKEIKEMSQEDLEDFLDAVELSEEELMETAADGVCYTGGFKSFMEMSPYLSFYLTEKPRECYEYDSSYVGKFYVTTAMDIYEFGGNLNLNMGAYDEDLGALDYYGDITVNIAPLPYLQAAIDTNNNGEMILPFLEENGFGKRTGCVLRSGFCEYPVFQFNEDKLRQLFPEKLAEYAELHGIALKDKKPSLNEQISGAKEKTAPAQNERKGQELEK